MNKVHVIVNPFSARGKTGQRWNTIKEVIRHYFKEYKYIFTEKPRQATEIARDLFKDGFDLIIGVGGDGTLNEITNGYFQHQGHQAINSDAAIGIIPSGTGSDFIRFLKIPKDFKRSVELIKNSGARQIDVGKIIYPPVEEDNTRESNYFINISDFGLGADVVNTVSSVPSGKRGAFSYYMGLLSTIRKYKSKNVRIVFDDSQEVSGRYLIGAVANGRIFGGGMMIAPEAEPDDGFFDVVLVEEMTRLETIYNSRFLYNGKLLTHPKVHLIRAKNIKVFTEPGEQVNIEYDGEMGKTAPVEYQILEKSVNFRV